MAEQQLLAVEIPNNIEEWGIDVQYYFFHDHAVKICQSDSVLVLMQDGKFCDMIGTINPRKGADYEKISEILDYDICSKHGFTSVGLNMDSSYNECINKLSKHYQYIVRVDEYAKGIRDRKKRRFAKLR